MHNNTITIIVSISILTLVGCKPYSTDNEYVYDSQKHIIAGADPATFTMVARHLTEAGS